MLDARTLKTKRKNNEKKDLEHIVKYHYNIIDGMIKENINDLKLYYHVNNFIPGYNLYNNELITKHLVKKLLDEMYEIDIVSKTSFWIRWNIDISSLYRQYMLNLKDCIKANIMEVFEQNGRQLYYTIPHSIDHDMKQIKKDIIKFLKINHYKVEYEDSSRTIKISW